MERKIPRRLIMACGTVPPDAYLWDLMVPPEGALLEINVKDHSLFVYRDRFFPDLLNLVRVDVIGEPRPTLALFDQPAHEQWLSTVIDAAGIEISDARFRFIPAEEVPEDEWKFLHGAVAFERLEKLIRDKRGLGNNPQ